jgi:hypothetical protein
VVAEVKRRIESSKEGLPVVLSVTLGSYRPIVAQGDLILSMCENAEEQMPIALNLGPYPASVRFLQPLRGQVLVSSLAEGDGETINGVIDLRDHYGLVIDLVHAPPTATVSAGFLPQNANHAAPHHRSGCTHGAQNHARGTRSAVFPDRKSKIRSNTGAKSP